MHTIQPDIAAHRPRPLLRGLLLVAVGTMLAAFSTVAPHAQRRQEPPVRLTGVTARKSSDGKTIYTLTADKPLNRAQTWQDGSGQHVVIYKGDAELRGALPAGVRVNRIGESLELVLPAREGQRIVVQPGTNQLDFIVSGGSTSATSNETSARAETPNSAMRDAPTRAANFAYRARPMRETARRTPTVRTPSAVASVTSMNPVDVAAKSAATPIATPVPTLPPTTETNATAPPAAEATPAANVTAAVVPPADVKTPTQEPQPAPVIGSDNSSPLFTYSIVAGTMVCGLMGLIVMRRRRQTDEQQEIKEFFDSKEEQSATSGKEKNKEKRKPR